MINLIELEQLLIDLEEYLDDKADINYYVDGFRHVPNTEMKLLNKVREIQESLNESENNGSNAGN